MIKDLVLYLLRSVFTYNLLCLILMASPTLPDKGHTQQKEILSFCARILGSCRA